MKSDNGRIINISALAHYSATMNLEDLNSQIDFKAGQAFGQSKLALVMFTRHFSKLLKGKLKFLYDFDDQVRLCLRYKHNR